ncbi:hypothetical protein AB1Y20_006221 [Prymnesium parvum]|uniref:Uncharacterized protein n=1 Tax=Prymnesium parvum TaxID=97485 RepID=A0AB34J3C9_PRYPA
MRVLLPLVDVLFSIPAAFALSALLGLLTISATVYSLLRLRKRGAALSHTSNDSPVSTTCAVFMVKGYGVPLLVTLLYRDYDAVVAVCTGWAALAIGQTQSNSCMQHLQLTGSLDIAFVYLLLPCLCMPVFVVHGIGAAWLVHLCISFLWLHAEQASAAFFVGGAMWMCAVYCAAWLVGLLQPLQEIRVSEAFLLGVAIAVLYACPRNLRLCVIMAASAWSHNTRAVLASTVALFRSLSEKIGPLNASMTAAVVTECKDLSSDTASP